MQNFNKTLEKLYLQTCILDTKESNMKNFAYVPCTCTHSPPRPPHGRIVETSKEFTENCEEGGFRVTTIDGSEAFLGVMVAGDCIDQAPALRMLAQIREHGVPEDIMPPGRDPVLYQALRHVYSQNPRGSFPRLFPG